MDTALGTYLDRIFSAFHAPGSPEHLYSLVDRGPNKGPRRCTLYFDGGRIAPPGPPALALSYLLWHVNRSVVTSTPEYLLVHACAVEHDGVGLIFPAPMDSGKTTLAAGLVRAGLRYVTDEAAAFDPATLELVPYPKPLSVDAGSWETLADLRPAVDEAVAPYVGRQWQVEPDSIRSGAVAPRCRPGYIISLRYEAGGTTRLMPVRRSQALYGLAVNAFNLSGHGQYGLSALSEIVQGCRSFDLVVSDLADACRLVLRLLDDAQVRRVNT